MNITLLNNFIVIKVESSPKKIGMIHIPENSQKKTNVGKVLEISDKLNKEIKVGDTVYFTERFMRLGYRDFNYWLDDEHIIIPYTDINARKNENMGIEAVGSKIIVSIDKDIQKENNLIPVSNEVSLYMPEFNNQFNFNNQFGECISVGADVKEDIQVGDTAFFNHFIESKDQYLIYKMENGNEIRFVETGTQMDYEFYGFSRDNKILSSKNYVFVEKPLEEKLEQVESGLHLNQNKSKNKSLTEFIIMHQDSGDYFTIGSHILAKGKANEIGKTEIFFVDKELIEVIL